jgi:hypothetical protein
MSDNISDDFKHFIKTSIQKYGIDEVFNWIERNGNGSVDDIASHRYNLMEVFTKHQTKPLQKGSIIFLDKYRIRDDHHRIEINEDLTQTWIYSDPTIEIRVRVRPTSSSYSWIVDEINTT